MYRLCNNGYGAFLVILRYRFAILVSLTAILGFSSLVFLNLHFDRRKDNSYNRHSDNDNQTKDFISKRIWENNNKNGNGKSQEQQLSSLAFKMGIIKGIGSLQLESAAARLESSTWDKPVTKRILIVATWRSGSSFIGQLIQSSPGVFYSYEPLHYFQFGLGPLIYKKPFINSDDVLAMKPMKYMRSIFGCRFSPNYLDHSSGFTRAYNKRVWDICQSVDYSDLCLQSDFMEILCNQFPVHLMKTVRLGLNHIEEDGMLDDPKLAEEWKVIYLVRDPKAIMASRALLPWCQNDPGCYDVQHLCSNMRRDLSLFESIRARNPERYYLLNFGEFTKYVQMGTEKLFDFLGLNVSAPVRLFLNTNSRQTSEKVAWRERLSPQNITDISSKCLDVLKSLDYPLF